MTISCLECEALRSALKALFNECVEKGRLIDERDALTAALRERDERIKKMRAWLSDLQSGLYINCVYCGFRYGPGESTPATLPDAGETLAATALREHIAHCPDHPMSRLTARVEALEGALRESNRHHNPPFPFASCVCQRLSDAALAPPPSREH